VNDPDAIKVAILGCGPAGLFAAHAAAEAGVEFTIYSKKRKSFMRGAQYLHRPIPGLSGDSFDVTYELWGDVDGYRTKVYGDMGDVLVSPETLVGTAPAWDIREAYDAAWDRYADKIVDVDFATQEGTQGFLDDLGFGFDLVVNTIPAPVLCEQPDVHKFFSQKVWVTEGLKSFNDPEFFTPGGELRDLVVCSGDPDDWWYRQSRIHGWENTEFPHDKKPRVSEPFKVHEVEKPLRHTCVCHPEIVSMGRYGKWQKGVLSHESFFDTANEIVALEQGWVA
jgi:hypothetical protein